MARYSRLDTLRAMADTGLVAVFSHDSVNTARQIVDACAGAGARIVEFTNRGDFAWEVFGELEKYIRSSHPEVIFGAGSITDAHTAALYCASGANFIVGPVLDEEVAKVCNGKKIPYSPGCGSVTEIHRAHELGSEIVKVFPGGQVGGPSFVKSVLGPMPYTSIMPTGGVDTTSESIQEWFAAGVTCVGIGSKLINKKLVNKGEFESLRQHIAATLSIIKESKK